MKAKTEKEAIEVIRGRVMDERQEERGAEPFLEFEFSTDMFIPGRGCCP